MMRRALRVSSVARPSSWVIVAVGLTLCGALAWAFPAARWAGAPLPWWLAQAGVPIVYGILVGVFVRRASWARFLGATALLWIGHLLAGALVGGIVAGPPPLLPPLLWVPLLLIPFHDVIAGNPRSRRGERGGQGRRLAQNGRPSMAASVNHASAPSVATSEAAQGSVESNVRSVTLPPDESAVSPAGPKSSPGSAAATVVAGPAPARRGLDEALAREGSAEVVRVSFARVADQLPAAAFKLPLERMAASLLEPGHLLVPQRLVLAQLAEGLVRAGWETVAEQFPRHLLALSDTEITRRIRDGQLVLPLDELVPQLPPEVFRVTGSVFDLEGLESFPEPFKPIGPEPGESLAAATIVAPAVSPLIAEDPAVIDPPLVSTPSELVEVEPAAWPDSESIPTVDLGEPAPTSGEEADSSAGKPESEARAEAAPGEPAWSEAPVPAIEPIDEPAGLTTVVAQAPVRRDDLAVALEIARLLAPVGPFNATVDADDDIVLLSVSAPGCSVTAASAAARLMLPILADGRAPWPIDQLILRGPAGAVVLTPLPETGSGGRVLVAAVPQQGCLALVEILCRRAAACHRSHAAPLPPTAGADEGELLEHDPSERMREIGASLSAVGPVRVCAFHDPKAESTLCLFLPAESDVRAIAGLAHDLGRAMRKADGFGAPMQSAELGGRGHRLMLRLPDLAGGSADITVVLGGSQIDRPGLAYRQLESAAHALRAG